MTETAIHYHAGWTMPGCLPESPYVTFDTMQDAVDYVRDELLRCEPEDADAEFAYDGGKRARQWHRAIEELRTTYPRGNYVEYDGYTYEAYPCLDDCDADEDDV